MNFVEVVRYISKNKRLTKPGMCPSEIYSLWQNCWSNEPLDRPTFTQIRENLDSYRSNKRLNVKNIEYK